MKKTNVFVNIYWHDLVKTIFRIFHCAFPVFFSIYRAILYMQCKYRQIRTRKSPIFRPFMQCAHLKKYDYVFVFFRACCVFLFILCFLNHLENYCVKSLFLSQSCMFFKMSGQFCIMPFVFEKKIVMKKERKSNSQWHIFFIVFFYGNLFCIIVKNDE